MDTTYSKAVALAVPVFLALIALEFFVDRIKRTRYYHLADAINSARVLRLPEHFLL